VQIVTYGALGDVAPLFASLRASTLAPARVRVWHNGPRFDEAPSLAGVDELGTDGTNLGFGGGHNRLFATAEADVVVLANPDLVLEPRCLERLVAACARDPDAVLVAAALADEARPPRVNAFAQRLTYDLVGFNPDRGRPFEALLTAGPVAPADAYVAPSGALFAVNRRRWEALGGGPLFPESLFLYLEDVALGLRVRWRGGRLALAPEAWAVHAWSRTTGQRSALKLYHVERNRLWLLRAIAGPARTVGRLPFTGLRYGAYATARLRPGRDAGPAPEGPGALAELRALGPALARALRDGLWAPLPDELVRYLGPAPERQIDRRFYAPLGDQLRDPTA
jgi:GT2 family glycosyltransferase